MSKGGVDPHLFRFFMTPLKFKSTHPPQEGLFAPSLYFRFLVDFFFENLTSPKKNAAFILLVGSNIMQLNTIYDFTTRKSLLTYAIHTIQYKRSERVVVLCIRWLNWLIRKSVHGRRMSYEHKCKNSNFTVLRELIFGTNCMVPNRKKYSCYY